MYPCQSNRSTIPTEPLYGALYRMPCHSTQISYAAMAKGWGRHTIHLPFHRRQPQQRSMFSGLGRYGKYYYDTSKGV